MSDFDWKAVPTPNGPMGYVGRFAGVRALVISDRWVVGRRGPEVSGTSGTQERAKRDARSTAFALSVRLHVSDSRKGQGT